VVRIVVCVVARAHSAWNNKVADYHWPAVNVYMQLVYGFHVGSVSLCLLERVAVDGLE